MSTITRLDQLVERVKNLPKKRIAIAVAEDQNTLSAIDEATKMGIIHPIMLGNKDKIISLCKEEKINHSHFEIINFENDVEATQEAVRLVRSGEADVLMKVLSVQISFEGCARQREGFITSKDCYVLCLCY